MSQIVHIFRKDCRRFWPEILLSLSLTASFIWVYPYQWRPDDLPTATSFGFLDLEHLQLLANTVTVLLPVGWLLLIARVVHAENLVGNRQFWLTRPYLWQRLLAEKVLFLLAFLCMPFTVAQICLLARAGFKASHFPLALLFNLALIMIAVVLPLFALATVVSSLLRMIGVFLVTAGVILIVAFFADSGVQTPSMSTPYTDRFSIPAILGFCGAVLLIQYSSRKLWLGRALLVVLVLSIAAFVTSPWGTLLFPHYYPYLEQGEASPVSLALATGVDVGVGDSGKGQYILALPLVITGNRTGDVFAPNDIRVSIDPPNGPEMSSGWQAIYGQYMLPDRQQSRVNVSVNHAFLNRLQAGPVALYISLALTQLKAGRTAEFRFPSGGEMKIPQLGVCSYTPASGFSFANLHCLVAFHQPDLARVSVLEAASCDGNAVQPYSRFASAWTGALHTQPSDIGFTPVWVDNISLPNEAVRSGPDAAAQSLTMCPGSPVVVTQYELVRRFQTRINVRGLQFGTLRKLSQ